MDPKKILQAYMGQFYKTVGVWARESEHYEDRHKKRKFNEIMREMDRFARRYMGQNNYGAYYEHLILYLIRNGFIAKTQAGTFDVTMQRYLEYKEKR